MEATGVTCGNCGRPLDVRNEATRQPCPDCGSEARVHAVASTVSATAKASVALEHIRETVTRHKWWLAAPVALGVIGALAGYFLSGTIAGIAVGIEISLVGLLVRGKVTTHVRTITRVGRT